MSKIILSIAIDAGMATLLYFGMFIGNDYARNIFLATFWVFVVITILLFVILSVDDLKEKFKEDRKPRPKIMIWYSLSYDTLFSIALAASGFLWSGAIWWLLSLFTGAKINSIDDEIRSEKAN